MIYEEFNNLCKSLPATTYVVQWGDSHVWKVGGKVFAIGAWSQSKLIIVGKNAILQLNDSPFQLPVVDRLIF